MTGPAAAKTAAWRAVLSRGSTEPCALSRATNVCVCVWTDAVGLFVGTVAAW